MKDTVHICRHYDLETNFSSYKLVLPSQQELELDCLHWKKYSVEWQFHNIFNENGLHILFVCIWGLAICYNVVKMCDQTPNPVMYIMHITHSQQYVKDTSRFVNDSLYCNGGRVKQISKMKKIFWYHCAWPYERHQVHTDNL